MKAFLRKHKQYLLSGVSYVIPLIAAGGILIAAALAFGPKFGSEETWTDFPTMKTMLDIGVTAFGLVPVILSGFIANAMAGKPGLIAGLIGGAIANVKFDVTVMEKAEQVSAGFLGALISGLLAGYVVKGLVTLTRKSKLPKAIMPIMPILVIPIIAALIVGFIMFKVVCAPVADMNVALSNWLGAMGSGNQMLLATILGAMIAFDMGGPVNKAAFFFGAAMISQGNIQIMGCVAAAICTPPLGLGLATFIGRKHWNEEERDAGVAGFTMGMIGITEGAIPFAAGDPLKVIPSIMVGSIVAANIAMLGGVGNQAPHGGPIVLPVIEHRLIYILAIVIGSLVTALLINSLKSFGTKKGAKV